MMSYILKRCHIFSLLVLTSVYGSKTHHYHKREENSKDALCLEISKFTPNLCRYAIAQKYCQCCSTGIKMPLHCGVRKKKERNLIQRRIVGGRKTSFGDYPWHVSLRIKGKQWCSGAILSHRFILTAAHCFDMPDTSKNSKDWQVYGGDYRLSATDIREQRVGVKKITMHPKFDFNFYVKQGRKSGWVIGHNDIAILELNHDLKLKDPDKSRICLPDKNKKIPDLYSCDIVGWGHTSFNGKQPDHLNEAKVLLVPNKICNLPSVYNNTVKSNELFCAGFKDGGVDACTFDSGGSMVCEQQGIWYATGIVSSGYECARPHSYGLYTSVPDYIDWIIKSILEGSP